MWENVRHSLRWRPRIVDPLAAEHIVDVPREGGRPRQGFVESDSHAVPIAGFGWRRTRRLLRGHVGGRAGTHEPGLALALRQQLGDQTEVEDHDPSLARHQDVGWLDIPMQL